MIAMMIPHEKNTPKIRAKKSLGQNFLVSQTVAREMIDLASLKGDETVVEIGPGKGILTHLLLPRVKRLIAIEYDTRLVSQLKETFHGFSNLDIIEADALSFPFQQLPKNTIVISNLPYYIATPLLFHLLEARKNLSLLILMFQREVARRIVASPGNKTYGSLSIAVQYMGQPHLRLRVSRKSFRPLPKVESAVITLHPHFSPPIKLKSEELFHRVTRSVFQHRRKTLKNGLKAAGFSDSLVEEALLQSSIDPLRRPETLSLPEFGLLADNLFCFLNKL